MTAPSVERPRTPPSPLARLARSILWVQLLACAITQVVVISNAISLMGMMSRWGALFDTASAITVGSFAGIVVALVAGAIAQRCRAPRTAAAISVTAVALVILALGVVAGLLLAVRL
jgi:uncharacterized membrane protein